MHTCIVLDKQLKLNVIVDVSVSALFRSTEVDSNSVRNKDWCVQALYGSSFMLCLE